MQLKIDNLSKGFTNCLKLTHRKSKPICSQLSFGQDTFLPFIEFGNLLSR